MIIEKTASCELEKQLFESVYNRTPDYVKNLKLMDFSKSGEFTFTLKKEHLLPYDAETNPEGLNLKEWQIRILLSVDMRRGRLLA